MTEDNSRVQQLEVDIEIMKRENVKFNSLFDKLDLTIEKLGTVSQDISRLLAVHEQKLSRQEERFLELKTTADRWKDDVAADIVILSERINKEKDYRKEEFRQVIEKLDAINNRLTVLEKWRWWVMGGIAVAGFLLGNIITISLDNKAMPAYVPKHQESKQSADR